MKLLRDKIQIREIGFPPSSINFSGLQSTWTFSKELREHTRLRIGLVEIVGTSCSSVEVGDVVLYNNLTAVARVDSGQDRYIIIEDNLMGSYKGITVTEKSELRMENISFTPLGDRIIIQKDEVKQEEQNGLIMPEQSKEKPNTGTIVRICPFPQEGSKTLVVKEGDRVMFGRNAGLEIDLPEGKFLLMREADVFGIY